MPRKPLQEGQPKVEALTMRISPKMRYGLELLCRKQHRNITSVMEWALERALSDVNDGLAMEVETLDGLSKVVPALDRLWHTDEFGRIANLAFYWPFLMTYEEEFVWNVIAKNAYYWRLREISIQKKQEFEWYISPGNFLADRVKIDWPILKKVKDEQSEPNILPYWIPGQSFDTVWSFSIPRENISEKVRSILVIESIITEDTLKARLSPEAHRPEHNNQIRTLIDTLKQKLNDSPENESFIDEIETRLYRSNPL